MKFITTSFAGSGGSIGPVTVLKHGEQYHARARRRPRRIITNQTNQFRTQWSQWSKYYANGLDPTIKANWEEWGRTWPYVNGLPPFTYMFGINWYLRQLATMADVLGVALIDADPGAWSQPLPLFITEYNYDSTLEQTTISGGIGEAPDPATSWLGIYTQSFFQAPSRVYPSRFYMYFGFSLDFANPDGTFTAEFPGAFGPYGPPWTSQNMYIIAYNLGNLSYRLPFTATQSS